MKCPTASAFGAARGPAPLVVHRPNTPGRYRSQEAFDPWK